MLQNTDKYIFLLMNFFLIAKTEKQKIQDYIQYFECYFLSFTSLGCSLPSKVILNCVLIHSIIIFPIESFTNEPRNCHFPMLALYISTYFLLNIVVSNCSSYRLFENSPNSLLSCWLSKINACPDYEVLLLTDLVEQYQRSLDIVFDAYANYRMQASYQFTAE